MNYQSNARKNTRHIAMTLLLAVTLIFMLTLLTACGDEPIEPEKTKYSVTIQQPENGVLLSDAAGEMEEGSQIVITVKANDGYKLDKITVNGEDRTSHVVDGKLTLTVQENITVSATFTAELFRVSGKVVAADGNLSGVTVTLLKGNQTYDAAVTADGQFSVNVGKGIYSVRVSHDYFKPAYKDGISVTQDTDVGNITLDSYALGDSPVGEIRRQGTWTEKNGVYTSANDRVSTLYVKGAVSSQYILQADVQYFGGYGSPRPGIILGQDADWITCLSFNLVEAANDWLEIVRIKVTDNNVWEYMGNAICIPDSGIRYEGVTLTVVRDNEHVTVYIYGEKAFEETECTWLGETAMAAGLFADCATTEFSNVTFTTDMTKLEEMLEDAKNPGEEPSGDPKDVDVIILAGQSNAAGVTRNSYLQTTDLATYNQALVGFDNVYIRYLADTNMSSRFVKCKLGQGCGTDFYGPEIGIAQWYQENYPDRELYIIKCAWGGTNLYQQWASDSSLGSDNNLYAQFTQMVDKSIAQLEGKNLTPKIVAFCWMQGEADGVETFMTDSYYDRLSNLTDDVRARYGAYAKFEDIAFVDATINQIDYWPHAESVNAQKLFLKQQSNYNFLINTQSLGLTTHLENNDLAHYDSLSMLTLGRSFGEKAFSIQESADKSLQKVTYTTKSDAVTVTDGADDHLVTAKVSRYDTADQIIVYVEGTDIDGLSQNDTVTFRISDGTNECSVVLTVKKATIGTEVSHGQNFVWKMSKTSDGYTALIIFDKALLGENVGDVLVETTLHNVIVSTDANLGNSPVGDVAQKGDWLLLDGKLENDGRSWTFFRGVSGTKYIVESTITLLDNGTVARPGVIVAQTEDWIIAFALQLNAPDRDWVGLIRISTQDPTVWEYMNGENGTMCNSFVSSPSYGVRTDSGCKMTAVRDGNNLYLLINDELITMVQECNWLGATETAACGLFNEDCTARYTEYRVVTDGEEVDKLLGDVLSQGIIETNGEWTEEAGAYQNSDKVTNSGGYKVIQTIDGTKYVVSATITLSEAITDGARPGIVIAGNKQYVLAFAYCGNNIGFSMRPSWEGSLYNVNAALTDGRTVTLTVVRDGQTFYGFVDGVLANQFTCDKVNADADGVFGFFNWGSDATYSNYSVDTTEATYNTWMAKLDTENKIEMGTWTESDGAYSCSDGFKVMDLVDTDEYVVSAEISLSAALSGGARPGLVVAGNDQYVLAVAFCDGYLGLAKRTLSNEWDIPGGYVENATLVTGESPSCTLTVLRQGKYFHAFINGTYIASYSYHVNDTDCSTGFFNIGCNATFANYSVDTAEATCNTWAAKAATKNKIEMGTWTESDGTYACSDGFKVLDLVDTDEYVVSAEISLSAALSGGARPGLVVAGNDRYVLAVAFCDGWIGLAKRTLSNEWDIPAGYVENAILATGESPTCTLTVLRQGQNFHAFINGTYIATYSYQVMNVDCSTGLFNIGCDATFASYSVDKTTDTVAAWAAKLPS